MSPCYTTDSKKNTCRTDGLFLLLQVQLITTFEGVTNLPQLIIDGNTSVRMEEVNNMILNLAHGTFIWKLMQIMATLVP